MEDIVVVGASLAGLRAVEALRDKGHEGRIVLIGAERHLPYDRPPLSKEVLQGDKEPESTALRGADKLEDLDVDLMLETRATALDPVAKRVEIDGGQPVPYDGLIIATGAHPREIETNLQGVYVLRTVDDCIALRAELEQGPRVVVVGAGFIGSEVAATCWRRGLDVTVLEALPVPLSRALGDEMGRACGLLHEDHGVALKCGVGVSGFEGAGRVEAVRLTDGSTVPADVVVVGIGVAPTTDWLATSGLVLDNGVVCDATCTSSVPGVVAAGDVARWDNPRFGELMRVEHWDNAIQQGRAAAISLLLGPEQAPRFDPVPYFWSDQYETKIQFVGRARPDDDVTVVHGTVEERKFVALYGRAGRLVGALSLSRPRHMVAYRNLILEGVTYEAAIQHAQATG